MSSKLYMYILSPEEVQPNDIQIIREPTSDQPGQARLNLARPGLQRPEAPNSVPLLSRSGGTIGFVANVRFLEAPYEGSYVIK